MKCVLMNKCMETLVLEYDEDKATATYIYEIRSIAFAPLMIDRTYRHYEDVLKSLNDWIRRREIPVNRENLQDILNYFKMDNYHILFDKHFGLSLSDQYWLRPYELDTEYRNVNYFDNDFSFKPFMENIFLGKSDSLLDDEFLKTPNNVTNGILNKAWVIENGNRFLLKGGTFEPFNEVLASMICERLGFSYISYSLETADKNIFSKCQCFTNKNTEFVSAYEIMYGIDKGNDNDNYEYYIEYLSDRGIKNAREKVEDMLILDYLIMNRDRNLNNFGIIRDVCSLEWLDVFPLFDNGSALVSDAYHDAGILFYNTYSFEDIIKNVRNISRIYFTKLDGLSDEFKSLLYEYKYITNMSDDFIDKTCLLLDERISLLCNALCSVN